MNRLYLVSLAVFVVAIAVSLSASAQANLLANPGFETGDTTGWFHWCMNSAITDKEKHAGVYSVGLGLPGEYDKGALIQEVTTGFSADKPLYASVWLKTENLDADAYLKLEFWGADGNLIRSVNGKIYKGTNAWTKADISVSAVPADTERVKVLLQLNNTKGKGSTGKVYFDDIYLDTKAADSKPL